MYDNETTGDVSGADGTTRRPIRVFRHRILLTAGTRPFVGTKTIWMPYARRATRLLKKPNRVGTPGGSTSNSGQNDTEVLLGVELHNPPLQKSTSGVSLHRRTREAGLFEYLIHKIKKLYASL